ncbi:hypothetical protein BDZ85DRAFT_262809 [Elsinoe ampelina]|uniref:F-box domain-containing protein n=1 Tax=Elsinoe ampelina TaxID=302913 RepID=A0A6A6GBA7_9PEZI|nr:hypothetical protein BDZ85DRAFT_262809 [Elsinoe ampelina]
MASGLPCELVLLILSAADPFTYRSLSQSCTQWSYLARDPTVLQPHLAKLPLCPANVRRPGGGMVGEDPANLVDTWHKASAALMLNARLRSHSDTTADSPCGRETKIAYSPDLERHVTLNARMLTLYQSHQGAGGQGAVLGQALLNDVRSKSPHGPILRNAPSCVFEIALARHSNLVAVALDRIVQVYDLDQPDAVPAASYLSSAAGHFITGISFEQDDDMLRIVLSNKGVVVYIGSTTRGHDGPLRRSLDYWKSPAGLGTTYLNSTKLILPDRNPCRLSNLYMLRTTSMDDILVVQMHSAAGPEGYVIFRSPLLRSDEPDRVRIVHVVCYLPAYHQYQDRSHTLWSISPQAKEHSRPRYALSPDGQFLAIVEEGHSHLTPAKAENRLFLWRIPVLETDKEDGKDIVARLPLFLGEMKGTVLRLGFAKAPGLIVEVETSAAKNMFKLDGLHIR